MKRALLVVLLVCTLVPEASAGWFRRRGGMLAEARATMAQANATMDKAHRMMAAARAMARDPDLKAAMEASERVLKLEVEKKRLELEILKVKQAK